MDFLRLQFTDILGVNKNVEVPHIQFEKALDGEIMFDGSSIEGFVRIEESDMLLKPDLSTFRLLPYDDEGGRVARLLCDIHTPDGEPVRRLSPPHAQAPDRPGQEARLHDDGRAARPSSSCSRWAPTARPRRSPTTRRRTST